MAWAFTSLRLLGVCRYLEYVDLVNSPRFLYINVNTNYKIKTS